MLTPRPGPIAVATGAVVVLVIFVFSALHYRPEEAAHYGSKIFGSPGHQSTADEGFGSVWNETLGVSGSISLSGIALERTIESLADNDRISNSDGRLTLLRRLVREDLRRWPERADRQARCIGIDVELVRLQARLD